MTDREMDQLLDSSPLPLLPPDQQQQIETAVVADLKPVRPLAPDGAYFSGLAVIFLIVCLVAGSIMGRYGWHALSDLQRFAVFAPLTGTGLLLAFSLIRQMRPAATGARSTALISAALFVLLLLTMTILFQPAREAAFVEMGLVCFGTGLLFAIPSAALFALVIRRGAWLSPLVTGAAVGAFAGLVGLTVLEIRCPNLNLYHILVWHVSVPLVCLFAGIVLSAVTLGRWTSPAESGD